MKMPSTIENNMFAPCGINCMVCYKHCYSKKSCEGCLAGDLGKPKHCRKCKIKDCAKDKGIAYCYECTGFPCKQIKTLEKSYNTRYGVSIKHYSGQHYSQGQWDRCLYEGRTAQMDLPALWRNNLLT